MPQLAIEDSVPRDQLINKLRSLGYEYKRTTPRTTVWRKGETAHEANVPRRERVLKATVRSILKFAGCTPEEIEQFVGCANA